MPQPPIGFVPDGFVPDAAEPMVSAPPRDLRGMPAVSSHLPERQSGLTEMAEPMVHPETWTDVGHILGLPVDAVRSAFARAIAMTAARSTAASTAGAVKGAAGALGRGVVNGTAAAGDVLDPDIIGVVSPRAGKVVDLAQKIRAARGAPGAPAAEAGPVSAPGYPRGGPSTPAPAAAPAAVDEFTAARTARQAPANGYPDQRALNDEAIAAARARYQARSAPAAAPVAEPVAPAAAPPPGPVVKESGKMRFTKEELTKFLEYRTQGLSLAKAEQRVMLERQLAAQPGFVSDADMQAAIAARRYKS